MVMNNEMKRTWKVAAWFYLFYETCLEGLSKTAYNSVMGVHVPGEMQIQAFSNTSYRFRYLNRSPCLFATSHRFFLSS